MKSNFKRFLSLMLAFVMILSNVPFQAFAEDSAELSAEAPAHVHAYESSVTKEATCGEAGEETFVCAAEGCDNPTYTEEIPATGEHQYADGICGTCGAEDPNYVAPVYEEEPELPTATVTEIENDALTFAMNFQADEATAEQLAYYGGWYADFELTVNKDVTLNANGDADGYLSGQYDEWSENWVNVPFENVTLKANESLKIMAYAAEAMGQSGLKLTYNDIVSFVKDFDCGVFFEPAFLAANPDLEVTLELRMYNPADEEESYVIGETYTFTVSAPELPTATVTEIENDELTFAMNFQADEADDAQLAYYGGWYADFELTVNKDVTLNANGGADGYLSGQYDEWSENWVNVPFENVTLNANESLKIMAYAAQMMGQSGLKLTYNDIVSFVKDFDCGVFFEPAFLAANPDLEVTLELRMYNPADESESYVIGETYTFTVSAPELPTATVTEIENGELTFAMNFKADEATAAQLAYYGDWYADFELTVDQDITLNANGGADGYLSGQYDEWSENWVNVPFEDVTLKADETLKIMAYAAQMMGQPGLKQTYNDVVSFVKDFDCGMFFETDFIKALEKDLTVTLALKMYNPEDETESYAVGETYTFVVPVLPTATVTEIENDELTFAMNFQADEASEAQKKFYDEWYADFELTANQDIVLNANGGADGYLSGQYDAWSENWVNVPFEDVTLNANESLKIMEYASELMGQPGLKYTYGEVYEAVKNFDCGMFLDPNFLYNLKEELEITLELKMYSNKDAEDEGAVIGETYTFTVPVAPELPTATAVETENDELTFAMNFQADEATAAQLAYYGGWYADFELTVNKDVTLNANGGADGYLSGQYDAWSENWVNVPFENVTLKANEPLKIMEYASELMGQPGLKYTYGEVYEVVKNFDCGMFFTEEFLKANPDLVVTLELKMYNPVDESLAFVIGDTYTFFASVAQNVQTGKYYNDVNLATMEAQEGQTVILLKNVDVTALFIYGGVTFDLNGKHLTAKYATAYGNVIDGSEKNTGLLTVPAERIMLQADNPQLPINSADGYRFVEIKSYNKAIRYDGTNYVFQPMFEEAAHELLLAGKDVSDVEIIVRVTWLNGGEKRSQNFSFKDETVRNVVNSYKPATGKYGRMYSLTLKNLPEGLTYQIVVKSKTLVELTSEILPAKEPSSEPGNVTTDANNKVTEQVSLTGNNNASAEVPTGTQLEPNTTNLVLTVAEMENSQANITLGEEQEQKSYNIHIDGVASGNTVPMLITLKEFADKGLNSGNLSLYHVENGATNAMTQVFTLTEVDAHNEFYYDPATGDVTMALATFSEIAQVYDTNKPWEGSVDHSWYVGKSSPYTIANADQLWSFSQIVGGMAEGIEQDSFENKTVKLIADINLNDGEEDGKIFYPIGYNNSNGNYEKVSGGSVTSDVHSFEGTFDGNGHTISHFYQNTWEMFGDYNSGYSGTPNYYKDAMGLFGYVVNGTVKNLTVNNFSSDGEYTPTGVIAAYAVNSTFENIAITNCNPRVYNTGNGGIVGIGGNSDDPETYKLTFTNITIDKTNIISALWGSYDVACGGLVGMFRGAGHVYMTNCHVAAQMDVYNDVCGNYQYYWYRYSGMMVGTNKNMVTDEAGYTVPETTKFHAENCTVHFGDWNDYYYCEFEKNGHPSYSGPDDYKFSRVPHSELKFTDSNGNGVVDKNERASVTGCKHNHTAAEDNRAIYLPFNQLFTGYGWGVKHIPVYNGEDYAFEGITILDREEATSEVKFAKADTAKDSYTTESTVTIGDLFKAAAIEDEKLTIKGDKVQVTVSPALLNGETTPSSTAGGTYVANATDWAQGTLTFSGTGAATITITDYYFCTPTTINVTITEKVAAEKFETKFTGDFLYRVGNQNAVKLGSLFKAKDGANIGNVSVTVESVEGTSASGTYTPNATWTNGTIQFSNTGVVKVTIKDDDTYCKPTELMLEVVDATNITSATGTTSGGNFVLLCDVNTATYVNYWNCTLYGNGFNYTLKGAPTAYNSKQGHGVLIIKNATLDNINIIGDIYNSYGAYTNQDYYNAAVDVVGYSVIQNCYIANCAAPVMTRDAVDIKNTTLYGGTVANLIIKSGTVTLENVTTANYDDGRELVGMGIIVHTDATETAKLVLNNKLTQYNFISEAKTPSDGNAKMLYSAMFGTSCSNYHFGTSPNRFVNTGIVSMTETFNGDDITDNANTGYEGAVVQVNGKDGYVYTQKNSSGSVNNNYNQGEDKNGASNHDAVPPICNFDYTGKNYVAKTDGSNDYCYEENGTVYISMDEGEAFNWDTSILTVTKGNQNLDYTVSMNGTVYTGKSIAFNTAGDYEVVYTYTDPYNFKTDENDNITTYEVTYTKTVNISVAVVKATTKHAEFTFGSSNTASTTVTVGNNTYVMPNVSGTSSTIGSTTVSGTTIHYPIVEIVMSDGKTSHSSGWYAYFPVFSGAVTITDYKDKGTGDAETFGSSTQSMPAGLSVVGDPAQLFKYQSSSAAGTSPVVKNNILVYSSPSISAKRSEYNTVIQYSYQDNAGATYYYYIGYHAPAQSYSGICVTPDTLVTLADGTKKEIQYVAVGEEVVAWNFYTGKYECVPASLVDTHGTGEMDVLHLHFEDGTELKVLGEHGIYDADLNTFIFIDKDDVTNYVGHSFVKKDGDSYKFVKLVDYEIITEETTAYTILSAYHYNVMLEDMFTVTPAHIGGNFFNPFEVSEGMKYDEAQVKADIETYGLYTYEDFAHVLTEEQFKLLNLGHFKVSVGKGLVTYDGLIYLIENFINR